MIKDGDAIVRMANLMNTMKLAKIRDEKEREWTIARKTAILRALVTERKLEVGY